MRATYRDQLQAVSLLPTAQCLNTCYQINVNSKSLFCPDPYPINLVVLPNLTPLIYGGYVSHAMQAVLMNFSIIELYCLVLSIRRQNRRIFD